jgi:hypothetical protein
MNRKMISVILLIVSLIINCLCTVAYGKDKTITKDKAIEIANNEVEKLGRDVNSLHVEATKYNTPWNKYLPKDDKEYALIGKSLTINNIGRYTTIIQWK